MATLLTNCSFPSDKKCSCFKNAKLQNQELYINGFDSIFQKSIHSLNFGEEFKEGSTSQVLFLEVDLTKKEILTITSNSNNEKKAKQSEHFKEYANKLLQGFDTNLTIDKEIVIPILIHTVNPNLDKILEIEDCKYYHKKLKKYEKSQIKIGRIFCFASSCRFS